MLGQHQESRFERLVRHQLALPCASTTCFKGIGGCGVLTEPSSNAETRS